MLRLARLAPPRGSGSGVLRSQWARAAARAVPAVAPLHSGVGLADTLKPYEHNLDDIIDKRAQAAKRELTILAEAFMRYDGDRKGHLDRDQIFQVLKDLQLPKGEVEVSGREEGIGLEGARAGRGSRQNGTSATCATHAYLEHTPGLPLTGWPLWLAAGWARLDWPASFLLAS